MELSEWNGLSELIPITPVEYSKERIVRYYGYELFDLDVDSLLSILSEVSLSENPRVWQDGDVIFYQYPRQPVIAIKNGKLFTTSDVGESKNFSIEQIRHQASILLRILHRFGLASYNRKAVQRYKFIPRKYRRSSR